MKIGRNELCPCGSGKKYKKCCLNKGSNKPNENIQIDLGTALLNLHRMLLKDKKHIREYHHWRKVHSEVLDSMISYFERGKYDLNQEMQKLNDYRNKHLSKKEVSDIKNICLYNCTFHPDREIEMMFFYGLSIYENFPGMESITKRYLKKNHFKNLDKVKVLKAMDEIHTSIYEVVEVDRENGYVYFQDVFTKKKFKVIDESLSFYENFIQKYYYYSRIITIDHISFGNCTMFVDRDNEEIIELIQKVKKYHLNDYDISMGFYRIAMESKQMEHVTVNTTY